MSEYEIPCLQFDLTREPGESWGLKIAGGIDQDASQNQFCPGDSGIFIISLDPNGLAAQFGEPLTLIREFLGPSPSAFSGKNPELSLVTSQLRLEK